MLWKPVLVVYHLEQSLEGNDLKDDSLYTTFRSMGILCVKGAKWHVLIWAEVVRNL